MGMISEYIDYLKHNPKGYWFKRKFFGWGWVPVRWQGWVVSAVSMAFIYFGVYVGETDDAPGAALLGILLATGLIFAFGYWKGEKPRWQWGLPNKKRSQ